MYYFRHLLLFVLFGTLISAAKTPEEGCSSKGRDSQANGALIKVSAKSQVGVLLDEIPSSMRQRVAASLLSQPAEFWQARAKRQLALTNYRLNFRANFYEDDPKKQLPLPPEEVLNVSVKKARRARVDGHDYVLCDYTLDSMLVSDAASPAEAEPKLARIGGKWSEPFVLPLDPELLLQRTGYACMDESEFPPNSVDTEDVEFFYDQECDVEEALSVDGCHRTRLADLSCVDALTQYVGKVNMDLRFERIKYSAREAQNARVGVVTNMNGADLQVVQEELNVNRTIYRYIAPDSCGIAEGCVGGAGWRRLLQFNASEKNLGVAAVHIGDVDYYINGEPGNTSNVDHHIYEYSECHHHYHFSHYGTFTYGAGDNLGSKRAFCLESVLRYSNNEASPITSPYDNCSNQGISPGWGDQYNAGIECQWIDVTTIDTQLQPVTAPLAFVSNPDGFLCEGVPVLDALGNPTFEATQFRTSEGEVVDRPVCDFIPGWDSNNRGALDVTLPLAGEGLITSPCTRGQMGPKRNCGFTYEAIVRSCQPGQSVTLSCSIDSSAAPQTMRVCEASHVLNAGVACTYDEALASTIIEQTPVELSFTCPTLRDVNEVGGIFALYTAPVVPSDTAMPVHCELR